MLIGIFRVSGHSMLPTLRPGRLVVVSSIPYFFLQPKPGDIVLFKQELKTLNSIKQLLMLGVESRAQYQ